MIKPTQLGKRIPLFSSLWNLVVGFHFLLWCWLFIPAQVRAVEVVASVDVNRITVNDVFTFKIEAVDAEESPRVDISPLLDDFTIVSGPGTQTNIQWINGRMTTSRSLTWTLVPKHTGTIVIPALPVKVGRKTYRTRPITMTVTQSKVTTAKNELFLAAEIDKEEAYVGEQLTVTYKLYSQVNLSISDIQFPEYVGFWTEELFVPKQVDFRDTRIQGVRYKVATLYKVALFPTKSGTLTLPSMAVKCNVEVRRSRRRRGFWDDPFFNSFDPLFDPFGRETVTKILRTATKEIRVKPYPEGQPGDFTGAVGEFQVSASVDTPTVKVNEAVTLRVELTGTGNISLFSLPELVFPPNLEVFPPTSTIKREPFRDDISGTVTYEYILIPRQAGVVDLPRIDLPYFNPRDGQWHRTATRPIQLRVLPGEAALMTSTGLTKEEVTLLGQDIRYIRTDVPRWIQQQRGRVSLRVVLFYSLAILFYFVPGAVRSVRTSRLSTAEIRQSRKALKTALKSLKAPAPDPFAQAAQTVCQYLRDKFMLPTDKLDPHTVRTGLADRLPVDLMEELVALLKVCDAGRFAPGAAAEKDTLLTRTKNLLKRIDAQA
jgi:hypothetical protein